MGQPPPRAPRRRQVHVHTVGDDDYAEHPVGAVSTANRAHGGRDHSDKRQPPLGGKRFPRVGEPAAGDGSWGTGGSEGIAARNRRSGMFRTQDPETGSTITSAKSVQARQREAGLSAGGVRWTRRGLARSGATWRGRVRRGRLGASATGPVSLKGEAGPVHVRVYVLAGPSPMPCRARYSGLSGRCRDRHS
jgi:hypothetical protein